MEKQIATGLKITFLLHFCLSILLGLVYLLIPSIWGDLIHLPVTDLFLARFAGIAFCIAAFVSWLGFRESEWDRIRIFIKIELVWVLLNTVVTLWGILFAAIPAAVWAYAIIMGGSIMIFGEYYYSEDESEPEVEQPEEE